MAQESQFLRLAGGPLDDPELAALLDPAALEKRLSEARTRRSAALARRATGAADPAAAPDADAAPVAATLRGWLLSLIFALGIGLGAAAVALLAQPGLRRGVALVISPEIAAETAPGTDRDTAPDIEPALARAPAPVATAPPAPAPLPAEAPAPVQASPIQAPVAAPQPYPAAPAQPPAPDPVAPLPARVVIHYPASALQEARNARDALVAAGASAIEIVPVSLEIGADNLRFYHAGDAEGAARVASLVGPALADGTPDARDFTGYRPPPLPGRVELWLAGQPERRAAAAPQPQAPRPPPAVTAAPPPLPGEDQAEAVARIVAERSIERMIQQQTR